MIALYATRDSFCQQDRDICMSESLWSDTLRPTFDKVSEISSMTDDC